MSKNQTPDGSGRKKNMPTASKLVSAIAFGLVALWAALSYIPHLPEGSSVGFFREIMAALGLLIGWRSMGRNAGRGFRQSCSYGLRTSVLIVFWALLGFSVYIMLQRSTQLIYHADAGRALLDVPRLMLDYGKLLVVPNVLIALVVGGLVGGLLAELTARRWS